MKRSRELTFARYLNNSLLVPLLFIGTYGFLGRRPVHPVSFLISLALFLPVGWGLYRLNQKGKLDRILGFSPMGCVLLFVCLFAAVEVYSSNVNSWILGWLFFPSFVLWSLQILARDHRERELEENEKSEAKQNPPSP